MGHNVLTLSDRDIIHDNKKLLDPKGKKKLQNSIILNYKNFKPDCIVLGHADSINGDTLAQLRDVNKHLRICQWFLDPIGIKTPDYSKNRKRILDKIEFIDTTFLTTDPHELNLNLNNTFYMPNPCDESFETLKNYKKKE